MLHSDARLRVRMGKAGRDEVEKEFCTHTEVDRLIKV